MIFTRMFALVTLMSYLVVGTVAVRILSAGESEMTVSLDYFSVFKSSTIQPAELEELKAPEQVFADIKFPIQVKKVQPVKVAQVMKVEKISSPSTLPFHEPVVLEPVVMTTQLITDHVAFFKAAPEDIVERVAAAPAAIVEEVSTQKDEVSTKMAQSQTSVDEAEPTFLDYSNEEKAVEKTAEAEDNSAPVVDKGRGAVDNTVATTAEEVPVDDLLTFDYSSVNKAVEEKKVPMVSAVTPVATQAVVAGGAIVTTQPAPQAPQAPQVAKTAAPVVSQKGKSVDALTDSGAKGFMEEERAEPKKFVGYAAEVIVHATATDFKKNWDVKGFELRSQDDFSDVMDDHDSGVITVKEDLAQPMMTRSVVLLKRGFAPTNTDLIIENGVGELALPLIEEHTLKDEMVNAGASSVSGAVLVELDDETEKATLDVPFKKILLLDGDMKVTEKDNFRYQLFLGVQAGNAMLGYKTASGETVTKVIHVHVNELTYDANYFETVKNERVKLLEESILSREQAPLIIAASQVKKFVTGEEAKKINDHTYKVNYERNSLAARRYLELTHLEEPVFVGLRDVTKLSIPSEQFMRFVLSKLEGGNLADRCVVQVNLSKKVSRVSVNAESVGASLMTYTQMLDADGKFYESASDKTRRVIVVGESQAAPEQSKEGKINVKVTYENGTVQYLHSYCSPNSYLVEQL